MGKSGKTLLKLFEGGGGLKNNNISGLTLVFEMNIMVGRENQEPQQESQQ